MKSIGKRIFLLAAVLVVGMPCTALAQERASRTPAPATPARDVAAPNAAEAQAEPTPAETAPRNVQTAPQRGILPEEIDRASRATDRSRAGQPTTIEASRRQAPAPAARRLSLQQMMTRLQPRQTGFIAARPSHRGTRSRSAERQRAR